MGAEILDQALKRVEHWPEAAQQELAQIALEIDAGLKGGLHRATPAELAGIDRGIEAARENRIATDAQVEAVLSKHRA